MTWRRLFAIAVVVLLLVAAGGMAIGTLSRPDSRVDGVLLIAMNKGGMPAPAPGDGLPTAGRVTIQGPGINQTIEVPDGGTFHVALPAGTYVLTGRVTLPGNTTSSDSEAVGTLRVTVQAHRFVTARLQTTYYLP